MSYDFVKQDIMYHSPTLEIQKRQYKSEDGKEITHEIVDTWNGVGIIPILPNGNIILVKQFRCALNKITLEIPSGGLKKEETELNAAIRELQEETGYIHKSINHLMNFDVSPGYLTESVSIFVAKVGKQGEQNLDDDEDVEILEFSQQEVFNMILNGEITDSKTLLALTYFLSFVVKITRQR